jgi:predicted NAD/FAD-binding protein
VPGRSSPGDSPDPRAVLSHTVTLDEVADVASFMASDRAGGMTATVANISCSQVLDQGSLTTRRRRASRT